MPTAHTLVLSRRDVASLVTMAAVLPVVESAFAAHGRGETLMPPKVYVSLPREHGDFRAMPAFIEGAVGVKWVNSHPENPARFGLPAVMGVYILSDPSTALPLAIMDATLLTAVRTGAAAAVASKHLGPRAPRSLGLVGCGVQARHLLAAHREVWPGLEVLVADVAGDVAARFAAESGARACSVDEASGCDLVCSSTPARSPVIRRAWVRPGAHVNAVGADAPGKQELDPALLVDARVFVDDYEQATHSGEVNVPLHEGSYDRAHIAGTLGEVIAGRTEGRLSPADITVFDSTGLAVQDLAVARVLYDLARERGAGLEFPLVE